MKVEKLSSTTPPVRIAILRQTQNGRRPRGSGPTPLAPNFAHLIENMSRGAAAGGYDRRTLHTPILEDARSFTHTVQTSPSFLLKEDYTKLVRFDALKAHLERIRLQGHCKCRNHVGGRSREGFSGRGDAEKGSST